MYMGYNLCNVPDNGFSYRRCTGTYSTCIYNVERMISIYDLSLIRMLYVVINLGGIEKL